MNALSPLQRVVRIRHELKRRELVVQQVTSIGAHFKRIRFSGESLADFVSASFDDHVKFILPAADGQPVMRDYTPRSFDPQARLLDIEFALHGDGPVAAWAAQAAPGQHVTVGGPRGSMVIPLDFDWHFLAGDDSALPAIARRLEELPAGARATVICQLTDPADRRDFQTAATVEVHWVPHADALIEAVRAMPLPAGQGYAWCAGEAHAMAALRQVLVEEKGHDRHAIRAAAYWKRGAPAHHENLGE